MKALWLLLFLVGCASTQDVVIPTGTLIQVRWIQYDTPAEVSQACASVQLTNMPITPTGILRRRSPYSPNVLGCYERTANVCVIKTVKFQHVGSEADLHETVGHELRHCYEGFFHTN